MTLTKDWRSIVPSFVLVRTVVLEELKDTHRQKDRRFIVWQIIFSLPSVAVAIFRDRQHAINFYSRLKKIYAISFMFLEAQPEYKLKSVDRVCTTKEVEKGCTEISVGDSTLKVVTCQETCTEDGCNTGWRK